jgi:hypothetical protein
MSKKHFIALADILKERLQYLIANQDNPTWTQIARDSVHASRTELAILTESLADFCQSQNPRFDRARWLSYIAGECGPNGGKR